MHKIDLEKYEIRTDMAVDLMFDENINTYVKNNIKISWLKLDENKYNKQKGTYLTLEFDDVTDTDSKNNLKKVFKEELKKILSLYNYDKNKSVCVVGLGNRKSTPDSLGPLVVDKTIVTKHLFDMGINVDNNYSNVSCFSPGVTASSGIETSDYIKGVVDKINPDIIIVIDALSSSSINRVNKSIQVSTSGISPGSGVGNKRKEISFKTLGIPVIIIGVPTVTSASVIVHDTINYMIKSYSYNKRLNKVNKLITKPVNYLKYDNEISKSDKKDLLGLIGSLTEEELQNLIYEVLTPIGYNLMVTPKEVDFVIDNLSDVVSYAINHTLHNI